MCSEVARLREQLALETASLYQGLHGYAAVAKHEIIQAKYEQIGQTCDQLTLHIGEKGATDCMMQALEQASSKKGGK